MHDRHSVCVVCCGFDCSLEKRCNERESWCEDVMHKYMKPKISLESKSRSCKANNPSSGKSDLGFRSASEDSSANLTGLASSSSVGISEDSLVFEIVNSQFTVI